MKISKKWKVILAVLLATVLLGTSAAFAGGVLKVNFGGGVSATGTVHVKAPDPTANQITVTCPDITVSTLGGFAQFYIVVTNNSAYDLTLQKVTMTLPAEYGTMTDTQDNGYICAKGGGTQSICIDFTYPAGLTADSSFEYSGELDYAW